MIRRSRKTTPQQPSFTPKPKTKQSPPSQQCTSIAISTGERCLKRVTNPYQLSQDFPKCQWHIEACKDLYPKYKAVCELPINDIPKSSAGISRLTDEELVEAKRDASTCVKLRTTYSYECFGGTIDKGHKDIIGHVKTKERLIDQEIDRRLEEIRQRRRPSPRRMSRSPSPVIRSPKFTARRR